MFHLPHSSFLSTPLSPEENDELLKLSAKGDPAARERIILAYIPLVVKNCRLYEGKGVPADDLFQEGCYGLMVALGTYDVNSGKNFSTHAAAYIKKYLQKAQITQSSLCPLVFKEDFFYEMQKYSRVLDEQRAKLNREPTNQELALAMRTTENEIRKLSQSLFAFFPLQEEIHSSSTRLSATFAEDTALKNVLDLSCLNINLSKRETEVLSRRLGFTDSGVPEDIYTISDALGLSYETIRATYNQTIAKLKNAVMEQGYTVNTITI